MENLFRFAFTTALVPFDLHSGLFVALCVLLCLPAYGDGFSRMMICSTYGASSGICDDDLKPTSGRLSQNFSAATPAAVLFPRHSIPGGEYERVLLGSKSTFQPESVKTLATCFAYSGGSGFPRGAAEMITTDEPLNGVSSFLPRLYWGGLIALQASRPSRMSRSDDASFIRALTASSCLFASLSAIAAPSADFLASPACFVSSAIRESLKLWMLPSALETSASEIPSPRTPSATNIHPTNETSVIHRRAFVLIPQRILRASWMTSGPSRATPTATAPDANSKYEKYESRVAVRPASVSGDAHINQDSISNCRRGRMLRVSFIALGAGWGLFVVLVVVYILPEALGSGGCRNHALWISNGTAGVPTQPVAACRTFR